MPKNIQLNKFRWYFIKMKGNFLPVAPLCAKCVNECVEIKALGKELTEAEIEKHKLPLDVRACMRCTFGKLKFEVKPYKPEALKRYF